MPAAKAPATTLLSHVRSSAAYLALLVGLFPLWPEFEVFGAVMVLIAVLASWRTLQLIPRIILLLVAACALASALWAPQLLHGAAISTARLTALVIAVMLLSATLGRSRGLGRLSASLLTGRALPRYLSLTAATGFLAIPLNFGSVGVMGAMLGRVIQQGGDSAPTRNMGRAVLRGFGLASICSPLSVSIAVTLTMLPGLSVQQLISVSLPFAVFCLLLGTLFREDESLAARAHTPPDIAVEAGPPVWSAWLRFAAYITAICLGAFTLYGLFSLPYTRAVAISCAGAVVVGLLTARRRGEAAAPPSLEHIGNELAVMCGSAFLGVMASGAGHFVLGSDFQMPPAAWPIIAFGVPWLFFLSAMAGLNPIVSGTFIGAMLGPIWPATALLGLGLGMLSGWGLSVAGTPFTASSMLLQRLTGYQAQLVAWRWNMKLSLCALSSAGALAALLTHMLSA